MLIFYIQEKNVRLESKQLCVNNILTVTSEIKENHLLQKKNYFVHVIAK
jgi:hypothetical protein